MSFKLEHPKNAKSALFAKYRPGHEMTVFSVMVKRQKSRLLPSGFFYTEIIIAKPKDNIHSKSKIQSLFLLRSSFFVLICFLGHATPFVLVHPGLVSIFNITTALHAGK